MKTRNRARTFGSSLFAVHRSIHDPPVWGREEVAENTLGLLLSELGCSAASVWVGDEGVMTLLCALGEDAARRCDLDAARRGECTFVPFGDPVSGALTAIGGSRASLEAVAALLGPALSCGELARSQERLRLFVDGVKDLAIFGLDPDGRVASWNTGAARLEGWSQDEIVGRSFACFFTPDDRAACKPEATLRVALRRGRFEEESWRVRKDGHRYWARSVVTPLFEEGVHVGFANVVTDYTERHAYEDQLAEAHDRVRELARQLDRSAEEEKVSLAREIHDVLGQTLTALKMDVAWVKKRATGDEVVERLSAMSSAIDEAARTVRRIAMGLRPMMLDDLGLAAAVEWQVKELAARSGLEVDVQVPADDVALDRERATAVFRVLQELLTNVARHAEAEHVLVRLESERDAVVLTVRDDGRGLAARGPSAEATLGVAGMHERAALFGGRLESESALGEGTRFTLYMPRGTV